MFAKISAFCSRHRLIGPIIKKFCSVAFSTINLYYRFTSLLRHLGFPSERYKALLKYKDTYLGKRCFIIATGPSLKIDDLENLKDEYTFGMNSICMLYSKISFRPTFYGIQDQFVFSSLKEQLYKYYYDSSNVFVSDRIARYHYIPKSWKVFPLNCAYNSYDRWFAGRFHACFSDDCYRVVYSGFSITQSLIQLAVYMGFQEIYLIGADCSFSKGSQNHVAEHGVVDAQIDTARDRNIAGYKAALEYAKEHSVEIFNATRGGELELFPRVSLDEVLQRNSLTVKLYTRK